MRQSSSPFASAMDIIGDMRAHVDDSFDFEGSFFGLSPGGGTHTAAPMPRFHLVGDPGNSRYIARLPSGARGWFMPCGGSDEEFSVVVIFSLVDMHRAYVHAHSDEDAGCGLPTPWSVTRLALSQDERDDIARRVRGARTATAIVDALAAVLTGARRSLSREFTFRAR